MSEARDPLDGLFASEEPVVPAGEDTQTGSDTQAAGDDTQTSQEVPGQDSLNGGQGGDELVVEGKTTMVPKAALDEARRQLREERERAPAAPKVDAPVDAFVPIDPKEDPQGAYEQMMGNVQLNLVNTTVNFSEKSARKEYGAELVDAVKEWALKKFETEPDFAAKVLLDPDPYEVAIADYRKEQRDEKLGKIDPAILEGLDEEEVALLQQHRASKTAASGGDKSGSTAPDTQPRGADGQFVAPPRRNVEAPPSSIATAPSGGKGGNAVVATGEGVAFDDAFK